MSNIDWSKAPKGTDLHVGGCEPNWWRGTSDGKFEFWNNHEWIKSTINPTRDYHGDTVTFRTVEFNQLTSTDDAQQAPDMVNHPPHYQSDNGIECIDAIRAALGRDGFIAYCIGNSMKYQWREKADKLEDMRKAAWYLSRAIEEQSK